MTIGSCETLSSNRINFNDLIGLEKQRAAFILLWFGSIQRRRRFRFDLRTFTLYINGAMQGHATNNEAPRSIERQRSSRDHLAMIGQSSINHRSAIDQPVTWRESEKVWKFMNRKVLRPAPLAFLALSVLFTVLMAPRAKASSSLRGFIHLVNGQLTIVLRTSSDPYQVTSSRPGILANLKKSARR